MHLSVFSQLRWNFVYQRPQHIMERMQKKYKVFYFEEPDDITKKEYENASHGSYHHYVSQEGVNVVVPLLSHSDMHETHKIEKIIKQAFDDLNIESNIFWYYTPMAIDYTRSFKPSVVVYDCMDQLSAFKFAPENIISLEEELFEKADVVFTGGRSLYKAKKKNHDYVHCFPSSIDTKHFGKAKKSLEDPNDQKEINYPRAGYFGVVDERFDIDLLKDISSMLPEWNFVILGPVVKIDYETLPQANNIHYLGMKTYDELPHYLSNWDVAIMPFALNESTEFISPTKTPEYLSAGKKVISTAVHDVVHPYEALNFVSIGRNSKEFSNHIKNSSEVSKQWEEDVNEYLKDFSWDKTCQEMYTVIEELFDSKSLVS